MANLSTADFAPPSPATAAEWRSARFDRQYFEERQRAGLDYLAFGEWQRDYGRWLVDSLNFRGRRLLDVGCACGAILRGLGAAGAVVEGVDLSEHMIELGRQKWPDQAPLMHVANAADLNRYGTASWHGLHCAQVAEYWPAEAVPAILRELARITVPGGLFFCALDTTDLFARQGRRMASEEPSRVCLQPREWWNEQLSSAGWHDCSTEFEPALNSHPLGFFQRYDWDWFVARRGPAKSALPAAPYDVNQFPHIWDCPEGSIDQRHLFWMFDVLAAGDFSNALEIGCLNGTSSTAFVEALNRQLLKRATFCDIEHRPTFRTVLEHCRFPDRIRTVQSRSADLLREADDFDFVFVDGDHRLPTVQEEVDLLLKRRPVCVMAHDTNAQAAGCADCEGPPLLKWRFQTTAPYLCLEDSAPRSGEYTFRGMFLATTSHDVFEAARSSLQKWGASLTG